MANGWNHDFDNGSRICVRQPQISSQFGYTLAHSSDSDSDAFRPEVNYVFVDTLSRRRAP